MRSRVPVCFVAAFLAGAPARAELVEPAPNRFLVRERIAVPVSVPDAWAKLIAISAWWGGDHTYSGDSANLTLDAKAGGCWCETWGDGQSIEHMRVALAMENGGTRVLRLTGGLGPLQSLPVIGVMTFSVAPGEGGGATIALEYDVAGVTATPLSALAAPVDKVLTEQLGRLKQALTPPSP